MAQVSLVNVSKVYPGGIRAVSRMTLSVPNREFLVLLGPSGCGKSTTLRMIAGLEEVTDGKIYIGDRLVNDISPKDRDIAMVFQNYALYPHLSVYDNLAFGLKLRRYPTPEIRTRVQEAADILNIEPLLSRKPKELSGGERQRVAVGRAIVRKPKVFLFDEPLSNLDPHLRVQMRAEIAKLHLKLQTTMIYVTHDQVEAMTMGNRIVVMKEGLIQQQADPMTLYRKPANRFVAGFIGTPPMNFVEGHLVRQDGQVIFNEGSFQIRIMEDMAQRLAPYENRPVVLGIRPEDIYDKLFVSDAPAGNTLKATVEVIEPMGAESYLYLKAGRHSLVVKMTGQDQPQIDQDVDLVLDTGKLHFFDRETDETIV